MNRKCVIFKIKNLKADYNQKAQSMNQKVCMN